MTEQTVENEQDKQPNLVMKYGIIMAVLSPVGTYFSQMADHHEGGVGVYVASVIAGFIGGAVGGYIRQKMGKSS